MNKPLGIKNYGSIPHLPNSRMGPGDHSIHEGQDIIATVKTRDQYDEVFVQEKLDGSNVGICVKDGRVHALTRSGYDARTSPYTQHHAFERWVMQRQDLWTGLLEDGERLVGEWLYQAHGTRYSLHHDPFVAFDLMKGAERLPFDVLKDRLEGTNLEMPHLIHRGAAFSVKDALDALGDYGFHGAIDKVEGAIWRIERKGKVDFLCKYVRPDKIDGYFLPEKNGGVELLNCEKML